MKTIPTGQQSRPFLTATIFLALSLIQTMASFGAEEHWDELSGMPTGRWGLSVVEYEGTLFAIGGSQSSSSRLSTVEQYDPSTDTWTPRADMPTARKNAAAAVVDGKIYVFGGSQAHMLGNIKTTTEAYDPATDTWISLTDMPTARFGLAAVPVDGKIYAICGRGDGGFERVVEVYDPATDTWETKAPYPAAIGFAGFAGFEGKIYMFGGTAGQFNDTTATRVYDPVADQWETKESMQRARILSSATELDGKFYVLGGNLPDQSGNAPATNTVEVYDPGTDTWVEGLSMPTARSGLSTVTLNGKIYAIGGHTGLTFGNVGTVYDTVEVYTPQTDPAVVLYGNIPDPFPAIVAGEDFYYPSNQIPDPRAAQSFVTGELGIVSSISLPFAVNGSPKGVVHFEIWDDNSGKPGTKVASLGDIDLESWNHPDLEYHLLTFDSPVTGLEPNTQYHVVWDNSDTYDVFGFSNTWFAQTTADSEGTNNAGKFKFAVNNWIDAASFSPQGTKRNYLVMEVLESNIGTTPARITKIDWSQDGVSITVHDSDTSVLNLDTVALTVDGVPVEASVSKTGGVTTISYAPATPWEFGSEHSLALTAQDQNSLEVGESRTGTLAAPLFPFGEKLVGPGGIAGAFSSRYIWGAGTISSMNDAIALVQAADDGDFPGVVVDVEHEVIDHGFGGFFFNDFEYPVASEDDWTGEDFIQLNKGNLLISKAGDYTIGVQSDDGFGVRVHGMTFDSVYGAGTLDPLVPDAFYFAGPTGNSQSRGIARNVQPGVYPIEFLWFERDGGDYGEIFAVEGAFPNVEDTDQWELIGAGIPLVASVINVPVIQAIRVSDTIAIDFTTPNPNSDYQLEMSSTLQSEQWQAVPGATLTNDGDLYTFTTVRPGETRTFYRVRQMP